MSEFICFITWFYSAMVIKHEEIFIFMYGSFTLGYFGRTNIWTLMKMKKGMKNYIFFLQVFICRNCTDAWENTTVVKITYEFLWPSSIEYMYITELQQFLLKPVFRIFREIRYRLFKKNISCAYQSDSQSIPRLEWRPSKSASGFSIVRSSSP